MGRTTITVNPDQKAALVGFQTRLQNQLEEDLTQGEALARASNLAVTHLEDCQNEEEDVDQ